LLHLSREKIRQQLHYIGILQYIVFSFYSHALSF
jgi:hypothetical protein